MDSNPNYGTYTLNELLEAQSTISRDAYPERAAAIDTAIAALMNDPVTENINKRAERAKYSTFWHRFIAALIDGILFAIVIYIECALLGVDYDPQDSFFQAFNGVQIALYAAFMHGFYGQTLGKMVVGVKVLDHDTEANIGLTQAFRRESVNLVLNIAWLAIVLLASNSLDGELSEGLTKSIITFSLLSTIWWISEFVTMLFNDKRRALHDYIGKTVVVRL